MTHVNSIVYNTNYFVVFKFANSKITNTSSQPLQPEDDVIVIKTLVTPTYQMGMLELKSYAEKPPSKNADCQMVTLFLYLLVDVVLMAVSPGIPVKKWKGFTEYKQYRNHY